jgi:hypothetical protein
VKAVAQIQTKDDHQPRSTALVFRDATPLMVVCSIPNTDPILISVAAATGRLASKARLVVVWFCVDMVLPFPCAGCAKAGSRADS